METNKGIKIPLDQLSPESLQGIIEEYVTRDGTDQGEASTKIHRVRELLARGEVEVWFDEATRSCNILPT